MSCAAAQLSLAVSFSSTATPPATSTPVAPIVWEDAALAERMNMSTASPRGVTARTAEPVLTIGKSAASKRTTHWLTSCSKSVLTCKNWFCATRPGDYCTRGKYCHDDCNCCRKDRKRSPPAAAVPKVRTSPVSKPFVVTRDPGSTYGNCEPDQQGHSSCRKENSVIVVCDPADNMWREVGACVGGDRCCESRRDNPNAAQCKC